MPNDITLADVQQLIRRELDNARQEVARTQPLINNVDNNTQEIDWKAVAQFMEIEIFEFVVKSDNPRVREFGRQLASKLADRFNFNRP
tara:strand:- start:14 stop:277 length:264 start_codon:yes stop_codon:yes gene_type:complete